MQIGYLTNCLRPATIAEAARQAAENGFDRIEVGPSVTLDRAAFSNVLREGTIAITALIYCRNMLDPDPTRRAEFRSGLEARIELAGSLGIRAVTTFTGRLPGDDLGAVADYFGPLADRAESLGVKIAFENCVSDANLAATPEEWRRLFDAVPSPAVGLCLDPSHLIRQLCDPYAPVAEFGPRIAYVHAKDTEIFPDKLADAGIYGRGWWRFRLPGFGDLNWTRWLRLLRNAGYDGTLSIEHEDLHWVGSPRVVNEGLRHSRAFLAACIEELDRP